MPQNLKYWLSLAEELNLLFIIYIEKVSVWAIMNSNWCLKFINQIILSRDAITKTHYSTTNFIANGVKEKIFFLAIQILRDLPIEWNQLQVIDDKVLSPSFNHILWIHGSFPDKLQPFLQCSGQEIKNTNQSSTWYCYCC